MTVQMCYATFGGDYEGVLGRLRSEDRIRKFALKFLKDPSYESLSTSLAAKDYETAFRAAHTLKGVSQNLGFTKLYTSSQALMETLRGGTPPDNLDDLFQQVKEDYQDTFDALQLLAGEA